MGSHGSSTPNKGRFRPKYSSATFTDVPLQLEESLSTVLLKRYRYDTFREELLDFIDEEVLYTLKRSVRSP